MSDTHDKVQLGDYIEQAAVTDNPDYVGIAARLQDENALRILHAVMGMVTEAGELMDAVKKYAIYGKPIDLVNLKEECGDTFWYQALLARAAGFTFEEAQTTNIEKLRARYPNKFTEHDALNRDLGAERKILEGHE